MAQTYNADTPSPASATLPVTWRERHHCDHEDRRYRAAGQAACHAGVWCLCLGTRNSLFPILIAVDDECITVRLSVQSAVTTLRLELVLQFVGLRLVSGSGHGII